MGIQDTHIVDHSLAILDGHRFQRTYRRYVEFGHHSVVELGFGDLQTAGLQPDVVVRDVQAPLYGVVLHIDCRDLGNKAHQRIVVSIVRSQQVRVGGLDATLAADRWGTSARRRGGRILGGGLWSCRRTASVLRTQ